MIKSIIIEDEPKSARLLRDMLKEISDSIEVIDTCKDLPTAVKSIKINKPELVFLDIELPVYSGLQLLDFLTPEEICFKIIFTSASNQHALRAFDMSAVDYVLKPIQYDKLKFAVEKFNQNREYTNSNSYTILRENMLPNGTKKIVLSVASGYEIITLDDIIYIKAEGSYSKVVIQNTPSLLVSQNLKHFEDLLKDTQNFIRIHRSFLANVQYAKKIHRNDGVFLVLEDKQELPLTPDKIDLVLKYFNFQKRG